MLILYFAIGTVVMKFVKKKEGIAVIPNVTFWRSAPVLVKVRRSFFFQKMTLATVCASANGYGSGGPNTVPVVCLLGLVYVSRCILCSCERRFHVDVFF